MLQICMVDSGNYEGRGREYVAKLIDMIQRNLPEGHQGQFNVFSDYCEDYGPEAVVHKLPGDLKGWWNKLYLFENGLFSDDDRVFFFDLDTVIIGKLDDIVKYSGEFAILRDFYRPNGLGSAVMAWRPNGPVSRFWSRWNDCHRPIMDGGDQEWIELVYGEKWPDIFQDLYPDDFVSYKAHGCFYGPPKAAKVVVFHGQPRPHQAGGWVDHVWKVGGGTTAMLESICNTVPRSILANMRANTLRAFPWLDLRKANNDECAIIGGGPSLPKTISEVWGMPMFALNAAATWVLDRPDDTGYPPRLVYQVILDARPEMAGMVEPRALGHYIASQCDPSVLEVPRINPTLFHPNVPGAMQAIETLGRKVHLIGGGSTVGLQAMVICYMLGYRRIHLVGMDSCYQDGEGHAYPQPLNEGERLLDVTVGDRTFKCAPWMAQQAEEFQRVTAELANMGCEIITHGDGLIPAVARQMAFDHMKAEAGIIEIDSSLPCVRAVSVLERFSQASPIVGAEIGVFCGEMSRKLLGLRSDLTLLMVDSWTTTDKDSAYFKSNDFHAQRSAEEQERYASITRENVAFAGNRAMIMRMDSLEAATHVEDGSLDFVFLDGDHSYEGCAVDIAMWLPKVKSGGWLSGHDYHNHGCPGFGVDKAVDDFVAKHNLKLETGPNFTWYIQIPEALSAAA